MRFTGMVLTSMTLGLALLAAPLLAQEKTDEGPTSEKAKKSFNEGNDYLHRRITDLALDSFKKADKQDDGHCLACQKRMIKFGIELHDWKTAEFGASEMAAQAEGPRNVAMAHFQLGAVLMNEGIDKHKDEFLTRADDEMAKALAAVPKFPAAVYSDGVILAHLKQDDKAKERFQQFVDMQPERDANGPDPDRQRALRYISQPDLARARMAPAFAVTTTDGQRVSMDDLAGKVVLLDFWATWCGPCREALPHMQEIAKKFKGQPLVVLSVSLDTDEGKWKEFVTKNEMTWLQYRDGGFTGPISKMFGVEAIPHTFTIDADGVLQDEHIGDASIEGKLKKLISRAEQLQTTAKGQ
jgi:thiol-disulfide isomerase/thioredoxin